MFWTFFNNYTFISREFPSFSMIVFKVVCCRFVVCEEKVKLGFFFLLRQYFVLWILFIQVYWIRIDNIDLFGKRDERKWSIQEIRVELFVLSYHGVPLQECQEFTPLRLSPALNTKTIVINFHLQTPFATLFSPLYKNCTFINGEFPFIDQDVFKVVCCIFQSANNPEQTEWICSLI